MAQATETELQNAHAPAPGSLGTVSVPPTEHSPQPSDAQNGTGDKELVG